MSYDSDGKQAKQFPLFDQEQLDKIKDWLRTQKPLRLKVTSSIFGFFGAVIMTSILLPVITYVASLLRATMTMGFGIKAASTIYASALCLSLGGILFSQLGKAYERMLLARELANAIVTKALLVSKGQVSALKHLASLPSSIKGQLQDLLGSKDPEEIEVGLARKTVGFSDFLFKPEPVVFTAEIAKQLRQPPKKAEKADDKLPTTACCQSQPPAAAPASAPPAAKACCCH